MNFVDVLCHEAHFIYKPTIAAEEGRLKIAIDKRTREVGNETKKTFHIRANYRHTMDADEVVIEDPAFIFGTPEGTLKAWKSEQYRKNDGSDNISDVPTKRDMCFYSDDTMVMQDFRTVYDMIVAAIAEAWADISPQDYMRTLRPIFELNGNPCKDDATVEDMQNCLNEKQIDVLGKTIRKAIVDGMYRYERTAHSGLTDMTFVKRKKATNKARADELGMVASLPVKIGYDEKKRKFEKYTSGTDSLDFGELDIHRLCDSDQLMLESVPTNNFHDLLIHGGRDANGRCVNASDARPRQFAHVAIRFSGLYFRNETTFGVQKKLRWLCITEQTESVTGGSAKNIPHILQRFTVPPEETCYEQFE